MGELDKGGRTYDVCPKAIRGKQRMPRLLLPLLTHCSTQVQSCPPNHGSLTLPVDAISSYKALLTLLTGVWRFLRCHHLAESYLRSPPVHMSCLLLRSATLHMASPYQNA